MSATGIELVTTVSEGTSTSRCASPAVVVPAESAIASPGETRLAACMAIAAFSARWRTDLAAKPGSCAEPGLTVVAPPCTFARRPRSASDSRSRRIVMSETPYSEASSLTRTPPAARTRSRIAAWRCWASIRSTALFRTRPNTTRRSGMRKIVTFAGRGESDAATPFVQGGEDILHLPRSRQGGRGDRGARLPPVGPSRLLADPPRLAPVAGGGRPAGELAVHPGRTGPAAADLRVPLHHPPQGRDLGGVLVRVV